MLRRFPSQKRQISSEPEVAKVPTSRVAAQTFSEGCGKIETGKKNKKSNRRGFQPLFALISDLVSQLEMISIACAIRMSWAPLHEDAITRKKRRSFFCRPGRQSLYMWESCGKIYSEARDQMEAFFRVDMA